MPENVSVETPSQGDNKNVDTQQTNTFQTVPYERFEQEVNRNKELESQLNSLQDEFGTFQNTLNARLNSDPELKARFLGKKLPTVSQINTLLANENITEETKIILRQMQELQNEMRQSKQEIEFKENQKALNDHSIKMENEFDSLWDKNSKVFIDSGFTGEDLSMIRQDYFNYVITELGKKVSRNQLTSVKDVDSAFNKYNSYKTKLFKQAIKGIITNKTPPEDAIKKVDSTTSLSPQKLQFKNLEEAREFTHQKVRDLFAGKT